MVLDPVNRAPASGSRKKGVGGWLLVLCGLLIVWHPLSFGLSAAAAFEALPLRGLPLAAILFLRLVVTALGLAAGVTLLSRRPGALTLARAALIAAAATDLIVYTTPWYPNNRPPGDTPMYAIASMLYYGGWLMYLVRVGE